MAPRFTPTQLLASHALLESNIGLVNPSVEGDIHRIMESFVGTYGIIVDLRQPPLADFYLAWQYLFEEPWPYLKFSEPSQSHPGKRVYSILYHEIQNNPYSFIYDRPVAVLMDEQSVGFVERTIMSLRAAPNVTLIGTSSMGASGVMVPLTLPGGITVWFMCVGVYTPEGGQTFRTGLTPDIPVERTIEGIREGRDEIMEAAIAFILENR